MNKKLSYLFITLKTFFNNKLRYLRYLPLMLKMLFLAIFAVILYSDRDNLYRFCRYPFPFIMCPICEYPCFFQTYRLQGTIALGATITGLVSGRVFCGTVCPVGTVQDWLQSFKQWAFSSFHYLRWLVFQSNDSVSKSSADKIKKDQDILEKGLRLLKYPLFLLVSLYALIRFALDFDFMPDWGLVPAMRFTMQVREIAGPGYINFWLGFLVIVFVVGLIWHRSWCKYLCPYGLILAVFNKISLLRIKFGGKDSTRYLKALKDCTIRKHDGLEKGFDSIECVRCYNCALISPKKVKIKPRFDKK